MLVDGSWSDYRSDFPRVTPQLVEDGPRTGNRAAQGTRNRERGQPWG
jgi:hypothetical protein